MLSLGLRDMVSIEHQNKEDEEVYLRVAEAKSQSAICVNLTMLLFPCCCGRGFVRLLILSSYLWQN